MQSKAIKCSKCDCSICEAHLMIEELKEQLKNSIPKDKIRELLENNYDISTKNSRSISVEGAFAFVDDIEELLKEE